jgi:hypothetical protein
MNEMQAEPSWVYEVSVERVRPKIMILKTLTLEVYQELWEAREALSKTHLLQ